MNNVFNIVVVGVTGSYIKIIKINFYAEIQPKIIITYYPNHNNAKHYSSTNIDIEFFHDVRYNFKLREKFFLYHVRIVFVVFQ